jgi:hypothetical protein
MLSNAGVQLQADDSTCGNLFAWAGTVQPLNRNALSLGNCNATLGCRPRDSVEPFRWIIADEMSAASAIWYLTQTSASITKPEEIL